MLLLLLALACLVGAVYLVGELVTRPARERERSIAPRRRATASRCARRPSAPRSCPRARRSCRCGAGSRGRAAPEPEDDASSASRAGCSRAGLARRSSPIGFLAVKGVLPARRRSSSALLLGAGSMASRRSCSRSFGARRLHRARTWSSTSATKSRRDAIRAELPDALDLLAVSVEAGLGFDGAIAKLTEHMDGPLADEFALTLGEMRIGESRAGRAEEARRARRLAGDERVRARDHPGRPARHLARPHPARCRRRTRACGVRRPPRSGR